MSYGSLVVWRCAGCGTSGCIFGTSEKFSATSTPRCKITTKWCSHNTWGEQLKFSVYSAALTQGLHFRLLICNYGRCAGEQAIVSGIWVAFRGLWCLQVISRACVQNIWRLLDKAVWISASFGGWRVPFVAFWLCWGGLLGCSCTQLLPHTQIRPP